MSKRNQFTMGAALLALLAQLSTQLLLQLRLLLTLWLSKHRSDLLISHGHDVSLGDVVPVRHYRGRGALPLGGLRPLGYGQDAVSLYS